MQWIPHKAGVYRLIGQMIGLIDNYDLKC
jgi:hypothetical protein